MANKKLINALPESDLDFIIATVIPDAKNKAEIKSAIRDDPKFRASLIGDDKLFKRVTDKNSLVIAFSPGLLFEILLRRSVKEMRESVYTVERTISQKIPVFDIKETLNFLDEDGVLDYLILLLLSFISRDIVMQGDLNLDKLIESGDKPTGNKTFEVYQRIGDVCLFTLGIHPEFVIFDQYSFIFGKTLPVTGEITRTVSDYEWLGKKFYHLAAEQKIARTKRLSEILELFSENFYLAKKPLNYLSEHFMAPASK
jgi:hypothetical protein